MFKGLTMKHILVCLLLVSATLWLAGCCCTKPPKEMDLAKDALNKAKGECANVYAADAYKSAEDKMAESEKFYKDKNCGKAKKSALAAEEMARDAEKKSKEAMEANKKDALAALEEAQAARKEAKNAIGDAKDHGALEYLPEAYKDLENQYDKLSSELDKLQKSFDSDKCSYLMVRDAAKELTKKFKDLISKAQALKEEAIRIAEEKAKPKLLTNHVVKKGECLWKISEYPDIYKDPFQWPLIWKANRKLIKDPDLIYPGWDLAIERGQTPEQIQTAIKEAKTRGAWSLFDGK